MNLKWYQRLLVYGITGWLIELFFTSVSSLLTGDLKLTGWSYLWMFPVWGFGSLTLERFSDFFKKINLDIKHKTVVYMVFIFCLEYLSGYLIKVATGVIPWDYSEAQWNLNSLIRLDYAPFWALVGLYLEDYITLIRKVKISF